MNGADAIDTNIVVNPIIISRIPVINDNFNSGILTH